MTDDPGHALVILEDILVGSDVLQSCIMIFQQGIHFQTNQLVQTHLKDRSGLTFCKIKGRSGFLRGLVLEANAFGSACHQAGFGLFDILAATEDFDDQVNDIGGAHETFLDFLFLQFLGKKLLVLAGGQVILKIKEIFNNILESQGFRTSVGDGQHVHAESIFQTCFLIEKCQQIVHICLFLQFQNDTNPFLGGLVGNIDNVCCLLTFHKSIDIIEKFADIGADHCVRNLGDDKAKLAAFVLLNLNAAPKLDLTAAGFVNIQQFVFIRYNTAGRKIRSLDVLHQVSGGQFVILHVGFDGIDDFAEIMRRGTCHHADSDTVRTVDKEIRQTDRKNSWLFLCLVKVWHEVYNILVKIRQENFLSDFLETGFGITHGGGTITFDGAEIAVAVYKRHAFLKILSHHNKGIVNGAVTMGMILTHGIADDTGAFTVWLVIADSQFIHII